MSESTFSIGAAAQASDLNAKTIRYHEQIGLIPPARRGNETAWTGGNRLYCAADIDRLRFIRGARLIGLGLEDIRNLLAAADGSCPGEQPLYHEKLAEHLQAIEDRIEHLRVLRSAVKHLMSRERGGVRKACKRAGCGCMHAPELSSGTAISVSESIDGSMPSGQDRKEIA